ncbi:hypothetical protein LR48_Vigan02g152200 [Vigna angularis]|uniref:Uncharacterized protein n=1 Tax=Phaseolus angularis TaxID=3914 RepID=A0A0L9TY81_PHAAN|nr:hypothetical protein LR48_Vigan02g152200 [Vigna angularis]
MVDKKVVLEHFDWLENKVDTLRKVAFGLQDLCKTEVSSNHRRYTPTTSFTLHSKAFASFSNNAPSLAWGCT